MAGAASVDTKKDQVGNAYGVGKVLRATRVSLVPRPCAFVACSMKIHADGTKPSAREFRAAKGLLREFRAAKGLLREFRAAKGLLREFRAAK